MSLGQLNKFLRDLSSSDFARRRRQSIESALDGYALTAQEKGALEEWQLRRLYDMSVNPLLLLTSSMATGKEIRSYVAALREHSH